MNVIKCKICGSYVEKNSNNRSAYCSNGHLVFKASESSISIIQKLKLKPLKTGLELKSVTITEQSKKFSKDGTFKFEHYILVVSNARIGEIVDIKVTNCIPEKGVTFAKVTKYHKCVGVLDFDRQYQPQKESSISFGGMNRTKCAVLYPEERNKFMKKHKIIKKHKKNNYKDDKMKLSRLRLPAIYNFLKKKGIDSMILKNSYVGKTKVSEKGVRIVSSTYRRIIFSHWLEINNLTDEFVNFKSSYDTTLNEKLTEIKKHNAMYNEILLERDFEDPLKELKVKDND